MSLDAGKNETPGGTGDDKGGRVDLGNVPRPGGRPRKDGLASGSPEARAADAGKSHKSAKPSKALEIVSDADAEFVADAIVTIWEIGDEILAMALLRRIQAAVPDKVREFQLLQQDVRFGEKDKTLVRKSVIRLAQRHPVIVRWAPELMLGVTIAQYGLRQARLFSFVSKIEAAAKERPGRPVHPVVNGEAPKMETVPGEHTQPGRS